ncbi:bifunctional ornithine acetyltransferase/N-acetylglutamate synthase, partial [Listeria monocytogenes]|uniref:bifunctional ornithine acetyltransferase/N-acetylglutamate synthase n=1 Tax=Listeria monocytogenes TaxID=1639 RepID=UPI000A801EAB
MVLVKGNIASPKGFYAHATHAGLKRKRNDIGWIYSEVPANAAAVYTKNQMQAAPIFVTKDSFQSNAKLQAIIVNSGNANACTGNQGMLDALAMRAHT